MLEFWIQNIKSLKLSPRSWSKSERIITNIWGMFFSNREKINELAPGALAVYEVKMTKQEWHRNVRKK